MPLIKNYQKKVWVAQLRVNMNLIENGFKNMLAVNEVDSLKKTPMWEEVNNNINPIPISFAYPNTVNEFNKYFKGATFKNFQVKTMPLGGLHRYMPEPYDEYYSVQLQNGAMIRFTLFKETGVDKYGEACKKIRLAGGNTCVKVSEIKIDVNGEQGPNTNGRDVFSLMLSEEGNIFTTFGKDFTIWANGKFNEYNHDYWRGRLNACGLPGKSIEDSKKEDYMEMGIHGDGCAARIEENDWKIDY